MAKHAYWIVKDANASTGGLDWEPEVLTGYCYVNVTEHCTHVDDHEIIVAQAFSETFNHDREEARHG